jgi:MoxR-like ATPase
MPSAKEAAKSDVKLRLPAEEKYAEELAWLASIDKEQKPFAWHLSPRMVRLFVLGSSPADKIERPIAQKFFGDPTLVERAIVTLASDRGLLLIGDPGTGKSWLAELLAAALCHNSTHVVQGTAGTTEDQIKYSWNVAMVIASGQSPASMIPSPIMTAMTRGEIGRFEELTRCGSDVQDALISILSEKYVAVPELGGGENVVFARPGFNLIATANSRDRGVNELSTALKRRFNFVTIPIVTSKKAEKEIVLFRTRELMARSQIQIDVPPTLLDILLQTFADLRESAAGAQSDEQRLESALSTAEQIGVLEDAILHGRFFGAEGIAPGVMARSLVGTLVRRVPEDVSILNKFWHAVVEPGSKKRKDPAWEAFTDGGKEALASLGGK